MTTPPEAAALPAFNALPAGAAERLLLRCVAVRRWAHELAAARPYADATHLADAAVRSCESLTDAEVHAALADHPRIGEQPRPTSATASWSSAEQSGVDGDDDTLGARLKAANIAYQQRFGHIYLVCATGRDGADLLADATARLANDPATELGIVRAELGKIALLRVARALAELPR